MIKRTVIGLDVGRSAVKAVAFADGKKYSLTFASTVSLAIPITLEQAAIAAELETVAINGKEYFTGETARLQGGASMSAGLSDDWVKGDQYKALVQSTMKRLNVLGVPGLEDPYVLVGTPAALFAHQRTELEKITQDIVKGEVKALSQPLGAYLSFFLDADGIPLKDHMRSPNGRPKSWAVVDVGHFTTDFLLMKENTYIESKADSCEGINVAAEHLMKTLTGKGYKVSLLDCEQALRSRTVFHFGEKDITPEVNEALEHVAARITAKADALLGGEAASLDGILLAGGGASIMRDRLRKEWENIQVVESPRMAVAEGYCRYGKGLMMKRAAQTPKVAVHA